MDTKRLKAIKFYMKKRDYWEFKKRLDYSEIRVVDFSVKLFEVLFCTKEGKEIVKKILTDLKEFDTE